MKASDIDMEDLALVYDDEFGPDYVYGILAGEFPAFDDEAIAPRVLDMLIWALRITELLE